MFKKKYLDTSEKFLNIYEDIVSFRHVSYSGKEKDLELSKRFDHWRTVAEQSVWCIAQLCTLSSMMMSFVSHVCEERLRLAYRKVAGLDQDRPFVFSPPRAIDSFLSLFNCKHKNRPNFKIYYPPHKYSFLFYSVKKMISHTETNRKCRIKLSHIRLRMQNTSK